MDICSWCQSWLKVQITFRGHSWVIERNMKVLGFQQFEPWTKYPNLIFIQLVIRNDQSVDCADLVFLLPEKQVFCAFSSAHRITIATLSLPFSPTQFLNLSFSQRRQFWEGCHHITLIPEWGSFFISGILRSHLYISIVYLVSVDGEKL